MSHFPSRYPCLDCNLFFTKLSSLNEHKSGKKHAEARIHQCDKCDHEPYLRLQELKRHKEAIHDEKKHPCRQCPARFKSTRSRARHERKSCRGKRAARESDSPAPGEPGLGPGPQHRPTPAASSFLTVPVAVRDRRTRSQSCPPSPVTPTQDTFQSTFEITDDATSVPRPMSWDSDWTARPVSPSHIIRDMSWGSDWTARPVSPSHILRDESASTPPDLEVVVRNPPYIGFDQSNDHADPDWSIERSKPWDALSADTEATTTNPGITFNQDTDEQYSNTESWIYGEERETNVGRDTAQAGNNDYDNLSPSRLMDDLDTLTDIDLSDWSLYSPEEYIGLE